MPHIRVLVPVTASGPRSADDLSGLAAPGVTLSCAFIPEGPPSIESRFDEAFSVPWLIPLALDAEREGVDGLVIDCMGDPGLGALREAVDVPVVGVAQAAMSVAGMLAQRFGVVTVRDRTTTMVNELVDLYGHAGRYVGCAPIDVPVLKIHDDPGKVRADLS
ncbi:MAG: hydrogenase expression protein HupH, partial [Sphingomonas sp.]